MNERRCAPLAGSWAQRKAGGHPGSEPVAAPESISGHGRGQGDNRVLFPAILQVAHRSTKLAPMRNGTDSRASGMTVWPAPAGRDQSAAAGRISTALCETSGLALILGLLLLLPR
jgi:hypothetical protein